MQATIDRLGHRVVGITEETRQALAQTVTAALDEGITGSALKERVAAVYDGWEGWRAAAISRTESMVSYNTASTLAYRESGVVDRALLLDNPDHDTDPLPPTMTTCADRDGLEVGLDEVDDYVFSAHPNCILAVAPILAE